MLYGSRDMGPIYKRNAAHVKIGIDEVPNCFSMSGFVEASDLISYRQPCTSPDKHHELFSRKQKSKIINERVLGTYYRNYQSDENIDI